MLCISEFFLYSLLRTAARHLKCRAADQLLFERLRDCGQEYILHVKIRFCDWRVNNGGWATSVTIYLLVESLKRLLRSYN